MASGCSRRLARRLARGGATGAASESGGGATGAASDSAGAATGTASGSGAGGTRVSSGSGGEAIISPRCLLARLREADKIERRRVHTVAQAGRRRTVLEDVSQMGVAASAHDLRAGHQEGVVAARGD